MKVLGWTDDEYLKLLKAAADVKRGKGDRQLYLAIRIAAYTGASLSGIAGMEVRKEAEGLSLYLPETKVEHRSRLNPCHAAIETDVVEWVRDPLRAKPLSQRFTRLKQGLGFGRDKVFHSFRHSVANKLENARIPDRKIKRLLGHKVGSLTFDTYNVEGLDRATLAPIVAAIQWPEPD